MPQLGETVAEGKITKWFKQAGDSVKPGENLFEIETDKTSMEVPATSAGTLAEIRVAAGTVAPVGAVVAVIAVASAAINTPRADARNIPAPPRRTAPLDPFNEVRTPPKRPAAPAAAARGSAAPAGAPAFYLTADVEVGRLLAARDEINAAAPRSKDGDPAFKLSVDDFAVKALAGALQRVPAANAAWTDGRVLRFQHSDVGVVVVTEGGQVAPVIREAETKSLTAIAAEIADLAARARQRKLRPEEYQGGATALSSLGGGIREFSAVITPPHASALAIGAVQRWPAETEGGVAFVSRITATLCCDSRVVDGAVGAQLLGAFKALIEQPLTMLV